MNTAPPPVVLLVENDAVWAALLTKVLHQEGATVLGPVATAAAARALCATAHPAPTLAVLDIGLDGPEDGLQLGHWLQQHRALPLLYCTAHTEPARFAEARATAPLAYVRKGSPAAALRQQLVLALDQARRQAPPAPAAPRHLWLPVAKGHCCVPVADLLYAEARQHTCVLATATGRHTVHKSLRELLALLQPAGFVQVHRSFLLNPAHLWHLAKDRTTLGVGPVLVPLGDSYRDELLRHLPLLR